MIKNLIVKSNNINNIKYVAMNVDYIIDTEEIKAFVQNFGFDNNFDQ